MKKIPIVVKNDYCLNSKVNVTFEEVLSYGDRTFKSWTKNLKSEILYAWDKLGVAPRTYFSEKEIIKSFNELCDIDISDFLKEDELTFDKDCIVNKSSPRIGKSCLSFFPNMDKTEDVEEDSEKGESVYSLIKSRTKDDLRTFEKICRKGFRDDSFGTFSRSVLRDDSKSLFKVVKGTKWIEKFVSQQLLEPYSNYGFWLDCGTKITSKYLKLSKLDIETLLSKKLISQRHFPNIKIKDITDERFVIRLYVKGQKVLPKGFRFFQVSKIRSANNFPPSISKFIYTKYTNKLKNQKNIVIYDSSAGFGGRFLGALSINNDRQIHYVGTDPNLENWLEEYKRSRYEYMEGVFNSNVRRKHKTTCEIFTLGSEVIHKDKKFKKYKGKIDLFFTSPPYFCIEGYSKDKTQSHIKFPDYDEWKEEFMKKTLETATEYLKSNRWLLINVADIKVGSKSYPLEKDTVDIIKSLGLKYEGKLKMILSVSPGQKVNKFTRLPGNKNFCLINGIKRKYEPIFTFLKP